MGADMIAWLAIGVACAALAATAPLRWAMAIVVFCLPLSGTAAAIVGGNPILFPLIVTCGFLARHGVTLFKAPLREQFVKLGRADLTLLAFAAYCVVSGLFFPLLFAGATTVYPQKFVHGGVTLGPAQVSFVQIAYLLLGVWTYLALRQGMLREGLEGVVLALFAQAAVFAGIGLLQALIGFAGLQLPTGWIVNNTAYGLLTQVVEEGFTRITSVFIEASYYGYWATGALGFFYALYVSRVFPAITLSLTAIVGLTLVLSTSSTSYVGVVVFGAFAVLHALLDPDQRRRARAFTVIGIGGLLLVAALIAVFTSSSGFLLDLRHMLENMTINKSSSWSAYDRRILGDASVRNALETNLLGSGYGSARSSGLVYQLIGTVGAPGLILFIAAMAPLTMKAFRRVRSGEDAVSAAGGFGLFCTLGAMAASGSDLALPNMFWVYAAIAAAPVALRARQREAQRLASLPPDAEVLPVGEGA